MPSRILLVRTDRIGDTLLTLPAVTALRQTFPDAFIAFLCQPYTEPMVRRINGLDQVLTYENEGKHQGFQGLDCLLYTSPSPRDGLLSRMPSSA